MTDPRIINSLDRIARSVERVEREAKRANDLRELTYLEERAAQFYAEFPDETKAAYREHQAKLRKRLSLPWS